MIDLDTLFDFIDGDASNHTHTHTIFTQSKPLHPSNTITISRVYRWYKRAAASIRHHRFAPSSSLLSDLQRWGAERTAHSGGAVRDLYPFVAARAQCGSDVSKSQRQ